MHRAIGLKRVPSCPSSARLGQRSTTNQDNTLIPLELTEQEKQDVVALLKSLNGEGWQQAVAPPSFPK